MKTYGVFVEVYCESPEAAVQQTIRPGCVDKAYVTDMGHQNGQEIAVPVPKEDAPAPAQAAEEPGALKLEDLIDDSD